ncbi:DUF1850 domain-containing protein [Pseudorhizobium marinum]|uniref:DUF1850 domain-containing protein n=1 Tax=Pseudorhizobium marinum TaxID=1496690 RepID=UPI000495483C|nr:DUF1850 domain-containing protein [Pseudorhizobium marinum]
MSAGVALCLLSAGKTTMFAASIFTLSWTHSVQKTEWREEWSVTPAGLQLTQASVKGSGAGMEPGPDAVLRDGWWTWQPDLPIQSRLSLAASGATGGGWTLCAGPECREIGAEAGETAVLSPCR